VKVNAVKETVLPEIDSTFMEKFGVTDSSIDTLKAEVKKNMERELKQALKHRIKQQVLDAALEKNAIDVPKSLIDQEINVMRRQMFQQFGGGAQMPDLDMNLLPAELFSEQASRRVGLGLLLNQLIEDKKLKADADKVRETVEEIASGYDAKEEVVNYYYKNKQQLAQIEAVVLEDLAVEVLLNSASVSDAAVSYEELMKSVSDR
jgi:trigger factor